MIAVVVPDDLAIALTTVFVTGTVSLIAFLFRQISNTNQALATTTASLAEVVARLNAHEGRIHRLEGFVDGFQFNHAAAAYDKRMAE